MNISILIPLFAIVYLALVYAVLLLARRVQEIQSNRTQRLAENQFVKPDKVSELLLSYQIMGTILALASVPLFQLAIAL